MIINLWTHNVSQALKGNCRRDEQLISTLKISSIIESITLKLTSNYFSGPTLETIEKKKK